MIKVQWHLMTSYYTYQLQAAFSALFWSYKDLSNLNITAEILRIVFIDILNWFSFLYFPFYFEFQFKFEYFCCCHSLILLVFVMMSNKSVYCYFKWPCFYFVNLSHPEIIFETTFCFGWYYSLSLIYPIGKYWQCCKKRRILVVLVSSQNIYKFSN